MARPTKQNPERDALLFSALREGNTRRAACAYAGVSEDSLARWLARSADFAERIKEAENMAEQQYVGAIRRAAHQGNWTAAAWWLERRRAQDWGRVDRVEVTIRRQAEKIAAELGLSTDEVLAEAERIVKAGV